MTYRQALRAAALAPTAAKLIDAMRAADMIGPSVAAQTRHRLRRLSGGDLWVAIALPCGAVAILGHSPLCEIIRIPNPHQPMTIGGR